jgi:seryl-tRNA synthetase
MKLRFLILALGLSSGFSQAAEEADPSLKLREQLRGVMLQLRTAQSDVANSQALQAAADQKNKDLAAEIEKAKKNTEALVKQTNAEKAASEESIAKLSNKLEEREKRLTLLNVSLEKWKVGYQKAAEIARSKEAERAKLAAEKIENLRLIADRERKNIGLFNAATEILDRYENYALGKALGAREPFIGTTRLKVENLVQGYKDKILDNRINAKKSN